MTEKEKQFALQQLKAEATARASEINNDQDDLNNELNRDLLDLEIQANEKKAELIEAIGRLRLDKLEFAPGTKKHEELETKARILEWKLSLKRNEYETERKRIHTHHKNLIVELNKKRRLLEQEIECRKADIMKTELVESMTNDEEQES